MTTITIEIADEKVKGLIEFLKTLNDEHLTINGLSISDFEKHFLIESE